MQFGVLTLPAASTSVAACTVDGKTSTVSVTVTSELGSSYSWSAASAGLGSMFVVGIPMQLAICDTWVLLSPPKKLAPVFLLLGPWPFHPVGYAEAGSSSL